MTSVDFVANRLPPLQTGRYRITAEQLVASTDFRSIPPTVFAATPTQVVVAGPRWTLPPAAIAGVYPPAGSTADHSTILPHVRLLPATLPWQRSARAGAPGDEATTQALIRSTPWLALLLFDADEAPAVSTVARRELAGSSAAWWAPPDELGEVDDDPVAVIDVPRGLLAALLPEVDELALLTHVRERSDGLGKAAAAVVLGTRLPPPGRTSTVHLVSVEHLAHRDPGWRYRFADLADDLPVRLVSLHRWSFTSATPAGSFQGIAAALDTEPLTLRLPTETGLRGRMSCTSDGQAVHTDERGAVSGRYGKLTAQVVHDDGFGHALAFDDPPGDTPLAVERPLEAGLTPFTICAWVKPRLALPAAFRPIVASLDPLDGQPGLWQDTEGGLFLVSAGDDRNLVRARVPDVFVADDTWVHVAWVRDGSGQHAVVDGVVQQSEGDRAAALPSRGGDLWVGQVGRVPGGVLGVFDGLLADVRVYDRALDDDEVGAVAAADRTHQPELAGAFTSRGLVPVEHRLRTGAIAASWLRSPLSIDPAATVRRPAPHHADGWLDVYGDVGMLDATLAAAWELGRQTMLSSRAASVALYRWRRATQRLPHHGRHVGAASHRPGDGPHPDIDPERLPPEVEALIGDLAHLRGVPISYLIPDPALLPPESLRMVRLDPVWVDAVIHGAMSVGAQSGGDRDRQEALIALLPAFEERWGFLLRSTLVADWPSLVVALDAEPLSDPGADPVRPLDIVRHQEIAPGVLLVLAAGVPRTLTLHLAPEEIHCGMDLADSGGVQLPLRGPDGHLTAQVIDDVPLRSVPAGAADRRVLSVGALAAAIAGHEGHDQPTPADMAVQMIAGVPQARFVIDPEEELP